ncbi:polyketide synthase [Colletotrichum tofieldiae]|nr:polyketide synthase [Colletotrichum tofieldiae]GKT89058.1 polyketide synthase [Colletotrichum tofieldiae]
MSGPAGDVLSLQATLRTRKISSTVLPLPYAFHSGQMDPVLDDFAALARTVPFSVPKIPFTSTLLGEVISQANRIDEQYLIRQTREAVDFVGGIQAIDAKLGDCLWLELGPASVLIDLAAAILPSQTPGKTRMASSLKSGGSPWISISTALAAAYESQQDVDWAGFYAPYAIRLRLIRLPSYAFDLKNYWRPFPARAVTEGAKAPVTAVADSSPTLLTPPLSTCLHHVVHESASLVKFRSSLSEPQLKALIDGHRLMDVPISLACVLGEMAMTAAAYVFKRVGHKDLKDIRLGTRDCVFLRPVSVDTRRVDQTVSITAEILNGPEGIAEIKMFSDAQEGSGLAAAQVKVHIASPKQLHGEWSKV